MDPITGATIQCVTQSATSSLDYFLAKIPLFPILLSTSNRYNNVNLGAFPYGPGENGYLSSPALGVYGLPTRGYIGFTTAGQEIYPVYNNCAAILLKHVKWILVTNMLDKAEDGPIFMVIPSVPHVIIMLIIIQVSLLTLLSLAGL